MKFLKSRGFLVVLTAVVVGTAVYLLMPEPEAPTLPPPPKPKVDPANCITLERDIIVNSWLGGGWHTPGSADYVPSITFVPSVSAGRINVEAFPVDGNCQQLPIKKVNLTIQSNTCVFPAGLVLDTLRYDFTDLDVDDFGDLNQFNFLRLVARPDSTDPTRLGFGVYFVKIKGTSELVSYRGVVKPCPPFCPQVR